MVVNAARDWIFAQLREGVDVVFANEDEAAALFQRFSSRGEAGFQDRLLSAMRFQFGGHHEKAPDK